MSAVKDKRDWISWKHKHTTGYAVHSKVEFLRVLQTTPYLGRPTHNATNETSAMLLHACGCGCRPSCRDPAHNEKWTEQKLFHAGLFHLQNSKCFVAVTKSLWQFCQLILCRPNLGRWQNQYGEREIFLFYVSVGNTYFFVDIEPRCPWISANPVLRQKKHWNKDKEAKARSKSNSACIATTPQLISTR